MRGFQGVEFRNRIPAGSAEGYVFAAFCVAIAAFIRWAIGSFFEGVVPFATFFPAALFAALVGGVGPGTFAAVLGGIIGWWAFLAPPMAFVPLTNVFVWLTIGLVWLTIGLVLPTEPSVFLLITKCTR